MSGYFKPLRRKIGILILVLACVCTAGWVRSRSTFDMVALPSRFMNVTLVSGEGSFGMTENAVFNFRQVTRQEHGRSIMRVEIIQMIKQTSRDELRWWKFNGAEFRLFRSISGSERPIPLIPYWSVVIPLTLLSAWLLLSRPRQKHTKSSNPDCESNKRSGHVIFDFPESRT